MERKLGVKVSLPSNDKDISITTTPKKRSSPGSELPLGQQLWGQPSAETANSCLLPEPPTQGTHTSSIHSGGCFRRFPPMR